MSQKRVHAGRVETCHQSSVTERVAIIQRECPRSRCPNVSAVNARDHVHKLVTATRSSDETDSSRKRRKCLQHEGGFDLLGQSSEVGVIPSLKDASKSMVPPTVSKGSAENAPLTGVKAVNMHGWTPNSSS